MTAPSRPSGDREALVEAIANALPLGYGPRDPYANVYEAAAALLTGPVGAALAQARAEALREAAGEVWIEARWVAEQAMRGLIPNAQNSTNRLHQILTDRADQEDPTR